MAEEVKKTSGRPKKVEEVIDTTSNSNDAVMEMLKKMQLELASLKEENKELRSNNNASENVTLDSDTDVEIMDLFSGSLTLYTEGFGEGTPYRFEGGFGSVIDIPMSDLKLIVKNNNKIARAGYFYIMNEEAIDIVRLKKAYESLIPIESMSKLSKLSDDAVIALYNSAPKAQKEIIFSYFASRKADGENVSHNLLYQLGELSGKKLID